MLTEGQPIWIPAQSRVLHGMYIPHESHFTQFPNAQRIIWIRDPLERLISLLNYWLRENASHDSQWMYFRKNHLSTSPPFEEMLQLMLTDKHLAPTLSVYKHIISTVGTDFFTFIGQTETYEQDLIVLESILDRPLRQAWLNQSPNTKDLAQKDEFREYLSEEYRAFNMLKHAAARRK